MRVLVTCLAFASHMGMPAAFYSSRRNVVRDEALIRNLLEYSMPISGVRDAANFWDFQGTAFAKLNLSLQVDPSSNINDSLLHLVTLMQKVLWGDYMYLKRISNDEAMMLSRHFDTTSDGDVLLMIDETPNTDHTATNPLVSFPFDDSNIISRALKVVRENDQRYVVLTRKRVMPGSGLGGGSADAAFILKNLGSRGGMTPNQYLSLGSDVSFLASDENVAVISGMGETITSLEDLNYKSHVYILIPDKHVSTRDVFEKVREYLSRGTFVPGPGPVSVNATMTSAANFDDFQPFNALERCVMEPKVQQLLQILKECDHSRRFGMSGSGCSCFLLDVDDSEALRIRQLYGEPLQIVKTRFKQSKDGESNFSYL